MKISHPLSFQADTPVPSEKHAPLLKSFLPYPSQPIVLIQQVLVNSLQASLFLQVSPPSNSYRILSCSLLATLLIVLKTSSIPSFSPTLGWTLMLFAVQAVFSVFSAVPPKKKPCSLKIFHHFSVLAISLPLLIITNPVSFFFNPLMSVIILHSPILFLQETYVFWDCKSTLNIQVC